MDDRRDLQARCVGQAEDPPGSQSADVALVDLAERAVPAAVRLAVVARPVGLRGDGTIVLAALPEQVNLSIVPQQLQIVRTLVENETRERAAASERDRCANWPGPVTRLQGAQVADEIVDFRVAQAREGRHAGGREPLSQERRQLLVGP